MSNVNIFQTNIRFLNELHGQVKYSKRMLEHDKSAPVQVEEHLVKTGEINKHGSLIMPAVYLHPHTQTDRRTCAHTHSRVNGSNPQITRSIISIFPL